MAGERIEQMRHNTIHFGAFRLDTDPDRLWRGSEGSKPIKDFEVNLSGPGVGFGFSF